MRDASELRDYILCFYHLSQASVKIMGLKNLDPISTILLRKVSFLFVYFFPFRTIELLIQSLGFLKRGLG